MSISDFSTLNKSISEGVISNTYTTNDVTKLNKKKDFWVYFAFHDIYNFNHVYDKFKDLSEANTRYSILTKVCYINNSSISDDITDWKMLGEQIGLSYNDNSDLQRFVTFYIDTIINRLYSCVELYSINYMQVQGLQILFYKVDYTKIVEAKQNNFYVNSLGESKDLINISQIKQGFNISLPLTMDKGKYGKLLVKHVVDDFVDYIVIDGKVVDFKSCVNKYLDMGKNLDKFNSNIDFYQTHDKNYIITVDTTQDKKNSKIKNNINVYNVEGMKINTIVDQEIDLDRFTRNISNVTVYINKTGIYKKIIKQKFSYVYPNKTGGYYSKLVFTDNRIGTLDLETYKDEYNVSMTYAIGFYVKDNLHTFYIDNNLNSDILIMRCLDEMLKEKYHRYTFYVHNLGGFDSIFLLKVIINACDLDANKYKLDIITRDETILSLSIHKKIGKKTFTIKIVDSYNILTSSLADLCKTFNCEVNKGIFPYNFVKKDTLFYKGAKPEIQFYN